MTTARTASWWRQVLPFTRPYRRRIGGIAALLVAGAILEALAPWPAKVAIDNVLGDKSSSFTDWLSGVPGLDSTTGKLITLGLVSVVIFLLTAVVTSLMRVERQTTGQRMSFDLAGSLLAALQRRSLAGIGSRQTGDIVQRVTFDSQCVNLLVLVVGLGVFGALSTLVIMLAIAASLNFGLALVAFGGALPMLFVARHFMAPMREHAIVKANAEGTLTAVAEQSLASLPVVQSYTAEPAERRRFRGAVAERLHAIVDLQRSYLGYETAISLLTAAGTALVLLVGGIQVLDGHTTVGDLVVVSSYVTALFGPLAAIAALAQGLAFARAGAVRVIEVLGAGEDVPEPVHPVEFPRTNGPATVEFEDVSFGYEPGRPVLHDIDLEVGAGETVALVGRTGAGKSTLVSLIPRFFDPWNGVVRIDGVDVRDVSVRDVRERVAVVHQESVLLPVSIADNIAYGRPWASRAEIEAAAAAANAVEFVEQLPQGYDTIVGERGAGLSGGQRQRIAIARALLKDAPVLVLDEPTSALDAESEHLVVAAMDRLRANRTVFVIAHRLSTVRRAHRIVVLDRGRIVEMGTHDQLLDADGHYARFHDLQLTGVE